MGQSPDAHPGFAILGIITTLHGTDSSGRSQAGAQLRLLLSAPEPTTLLSAPRRFHTPRESGRSKPRRAPMVFGRSQAHAQDRNSRPYFPAPSRASLDSIPAPR